MYVRKQSILLLFTLIKYTSIQLLYTIQRKSALKMDGSSLPVMPRKLLALVGFGKATMYLLGEKKNEDHTQTKKQLEDFRQLP